MPKFEITAFVSGDTGKVKHVIARPDLAQAQDKFRRAYPGRDVVFIDTKKVAE